METNTLNNGSARNTKPRQRFEQNCDEFGIFAIECRSSEDARRWEDSWQEYGLSNTGSHQKQDLGAVIKQHEDDLAGLLAAAMSGEELKSSLVNLISQRCPKLVERKI